MAVDPATVAVVEKAGEELGKMKWFRTMTFGQALLLILITLFSAAAYFVYRDAMDKVIPSHLKSIQEGYEKINTDNMAAQKASTEAMKSVSENIAKTAGEAHSLAEKKEEQQRVLIEKLVDKIDKKDTFIQDMLKEAAKKPPPSKSDGGAGLDDSLWDDPGFPIMGHRNELPH